MSPFLKSLIQNQLSKIWKVWKVKLKNIKSFLLQNPKFQIQQRQFKALFALGLNPVAQVSSFQYRQMADGNEVIIHDRIINSFSFLNKQYTIGQKQHVSFINKTKDGGQEENTHTALSRNCLVILTSSSIRSYHRIED